MKAIDAIRHHKVHKYTISGFVVGGILLLASLINLVVLTEPRYHPLSSFVTLVPGIVLVLRSLHPPIGTMRGTALFVGGVMVGATPMMLSAATTPLLWMGIVSGLIGAGLLGIGFSKFERTETK